MPSGPTLGAMGIAERRAVAASLRVARQDVADAALLYMSARNTLLLLGRAVRRVTEAVLVSERGMSALAHLPASLDGVSDANPLKPRLSELQALADAATRYAVPDRSGRLPDLETGSTGDELRRVRSLVDDALHGFEVDPASPDDPAGRTGPLRAEKEPEPPPEPARPRPSPARGPGRERTQPRTQPADAPLRPQPPAPPPEGPAPRPASDTGPISSAAFWSLMDRWGIGDLEALDLLGHGGGLTKKGTRPRFRLVGSEAALFAVLREIDATLTLASLDPAEWLRTPKKGAPLGGRTPVATIAAAGAAGARSVHHLAVQESLKRSVG